MENIIKTHKVVGQQSQEEWQIELMKQMGQARVGCLQELGRAITPILQKHNMILDIIVTFDSRGMKTALNVLPKQQ